jgi:peptide deformylase
MSVQKIVLYPDDALKVPCIPVVDFEDVEFKQLVEHLIDTAKAYRAQGLAANQIGGRYRVFVSRVDGQNEYKVYVNPELELEGDIVSNHEGCLSFPGATALVDRPEECTVTARDITGVEFIDNADDVASVAIQHETDHLDGILMTDKLGRVTKRMFLKKVNKYKRKYLRRI